MKRNFQLPIVILSLIFCLVISGCASGDAPARSVELYHQALVDKEQDVLINLSCADWESQALQDLDSFISVETELVDAVCQTVSEEGDIARVTCEGAISASYEGEATEFPLSGRTYIVVKEGGEWRMCGYE
jgi:hypothetical protein